MVPEITFPRSIKDALNYNEQKVQQGKAELILAGNFLQKPEEMNFYEMKERFDKQNELNERAKTKTIHISLNFHPDDAPKLSREFLQGIADEYMQKIGFGNQPYLVYQHHDAGHPHLHVVSILIKEDGKRINTHNIGKDLSEPVRKELEAKYGLVKADKKEKERTRETTLKVDAQKVQYGKSETKRGITNVLDAVIDQYKYTSLAELNAVLRLYNVEADRGKEGGRIHDRRGLLYRVLDDKGEKIGVPIKASSIYSRPTLRYLEGKFKENEVLREPFKKPLRTKIQWALNKNPQTLDELSRHLLQERVALVVRRNDQGRVYGMTYVDHESKSVFNGSDLGKEYSANQVLRQLGKEQSIQQQKEQVPQPPIDSSKQTVAEKSVQEKTNDHNTGTLFGSLLKSVGQVLQPEDGSEVINKELLEAERRRKRKQIERE